MYVLWKHNHSSLLACSCTFDNHYKSNGRPQLHISLYFFPWLHRYNDSGANTCVINTVSCRMEPITQSLKPCSPLVGNVSLLFISQHINPHSSSSLHVFFSFSAFGVCWQRKEYYGCGFGPGPTATHHPLSLLWSGDSRCWGEMLHCPGLGKKGELSKKRTAFDIFTPTFTFFSFFFGGGGVQHLATMPIFHIVIY